MEHDRRNPQKKAVAEAAFLQRLGVTNLHGAPRPGMAGNLRQIQRFVEIFGHLLEDLQVQAPGPLRIVDMGAGKGYLTFALAHALRNKGWDADVTGVEARSELVEAANQAAHELDFHGLRFVAGTIQEWEPPAALDVLVALHACNTATDDALYMGVRKSAALLLTSPCCHQEIRPQLRFPPLLAAMAGHGILAERQAEILTDALRANLLELHGYSARVFEFVEPEHSGKNLMLAGIRRPNGGRPALEIRAEILELLKAFGIRSQRLADLLGEVPR
jgi:SAM-dependent methyltransferase